MAGAGNEEEEETKRSAVSSKFNFAATYLQSNDLQSGPVPHLQLLEKENRQHHNSFSQLVNLAPVKILSERRPSVISTSGLGGVNRRPPSSVKSSQPLLSISQQANNQMSSLVDKVNSIKH